MKVRTGILREEAASILNRTVLPISLEIPYTDIEMYTDNYERGYKAVYNIGKLGIMEVAVLFLPKSAYTKERGIAAFVRFCEQPNLHSGVFYRQITVLQGRTEAMKLIRREKIFPRQSSFCAKNQAF